MVFFYDFKVIGNLKCDEKLFGCGSKWKTDVGPQMLVYFSIHHSIIGVPNFDPYPFNGMFH